MAEYKLDFTAEQINEKLGSTPDYEQNDNTAVDYIQNRPFYEEISGSYTPLMENQPVFFSEGGIPTHYDNGEYNSNKDILRDKLEVILNNNLGNVLTIQIKNLDGSVYTERSGKVVEATGEKGKKMNIIGNHYFYSGDKEDDTGEDFYFLATSIEFAFDIRKDYFETVDEDGYSTIEFDYGFLNGDYLVDILVGDVSIKIKQLDPKYIPDYISKTEVEELVNNNTSGKSIDSITTDENNNVIITFSDGTTQVVGRLNIDVQADFLTENGFGNLRFTDNKFQYYDEATSQWVDTQMTSDNVTIMNLVPQPMQLFSANFNPDALRVELLIDESADTIIGGQTASTVEKVIIRRKKDGFPVDENDGDLVIIIERKNFGAYKNRPYIDNIDGLELGDTYYYKAFPINNVGLIGYSASNETQFTAKDYWLFGFKLDQAESDPASMITYIEDNENYQSAYMDYDTDKFNYGSWENAWFMKVKPCMLNYDGTVAYYLNPNDYSLKEDGTASDIANVNFAGNAMVGIPKTYWKIVDNGDDTANIYFSNKKIDEDFVCWSHIDNNGNEIDYCYMSAYCGSSDGTRLRSLSGRTPTYSQTSATEINLAKANNQDDNVIWYTEVYSDRMLINLLLLLIGKSTNTQTIFGNGYANGSQYPNTTTGGANNFGLFWGANNASGRVKVFGIEHWYGHAWRTLSGWVNNSGNQMVKMTYGQFDGSTADGYNLDGTGYISLGCAPNGTSGGYLNKMTFTKYGLIPTVAKGSASTYYTDGFSFSTSNISMAVVGGCSWDTGAIVGAFYSALNFGTSASAQKFASISCKPLAPTEEVE